MGAARRLERAAIVRDLILEGWRPPNPRTHQTLRLLDSMERIGGDHRYVLDELTAHEQQVLAMVGSGVRRREIAHKLGLTPDWISEMETRIRRKLGARTNAHAVAIVLTRTESGGIVTTDGHKDA